MKKITNEDILKIIEENSKSIEEIKTCQYEVIQSILENSKILEELKACQYETIRQILDIDSNSKDIHDYDKRGVYIITTMNEEYKWKYHININLQGGGVTFYHDENHCYDYPYDNRSIAEENALILAKSLCETYKL